MELGPRRSRVAELDLRAPGYTSVRPCSTSGIGGISGHVMSRFRSPSDSLAPRRPIVVIQSDDWGRVGIPGLDALERVKVAGANVGASGWDLYGLETVG